ncbi:MAG: DUF7619 domain-containing protein [Aureispira sp.]
MKYKQLKFIMLIIFLLLGIGLLKAQGWEQIYPKNNYSEVTYAIRPTQGGGHLMAGFAAGISGDTVGVITQLNHRGEEQRRILNANPALEVSMYFDLEITLDGGFIVTGVSRNFGSGIYEPYFAKYDATGSIIWERIYNGGYWEQVLPAIYDIDITADSGFICTGHFGGRSNTLKLNSLGQVEWLTYGAIGQRGIAVVEMPDHSGYAMLASENIGSNGNNYVLTRLNNQGDTVWTEKYSARSAMAYTGDLIVTNDGHFAVTGSYTLDLASSSNEDIWIAKLDTFNGAVVWQQFFGDTLDADRGNSIINTLDGGVVVSGHSTNGTTTNARVVKLDVNGIMLWDKEYGRSGDAAEGYSVYALSDSSYVIGGRIGDNIFIFNCQLYAFKIDANGELYGSVLSGKVYYDRDGNCGFNGNDVPLGNRTVYAYKDNIIAFYGSTDANGNYSIRVDTGDYEIELLRNRAHTYYDNHSCVPDTIKTIIGFSGDNKTFDFPQISITDCPLVAVSLGTPQLRRCFWNYYTVSYCNNGTQDAISTEIKVVLDPYLVVDTLSLPTPVTLLPNNTFLFTIDTIRIGGCGSFNIPLYVDCDSTVSGQTHCSQVSVTPDTSCIIPPWLGANIQLDATCLGDSIEVALNNVGGNMGTPLNYLVYEDNIMLRSQGFQLGSGQSQNFRLEATGNTYRIEAEQPIGFPELLGDAVIARVVERCNGTNSLGLVNSLPHYDGSPFLDIDCRQNIGAYDPNDKRGFPAGIGAPNYITKSNRLDYNIRFQNTGTDTAFTIVVIDTIDPALDISTLQVGVSSHPYTMSIYGINEQIVAFTFNNILLVDSNANEPLSHGFVQFTVEQKANNPLGTEINNEAAIYFDFNAPIFTNTTLHTVGENFIQAIVIGVDRVGGPNISVNVIPNPFHDRAVIEVEGLEANNLLQLQVFNVMGQQVMTLQGNQNRFDIQRGTLDAGVYVFRVVEDGQMKATGKFIVR